MEAVYCANCKWPVPDNREPCPSCGSTSRIFAVTVTSTILLSSGLRWKHRDSKKKLKAKGKSEPSASARTGRPVRIQQVSDREKDKWWQEISEQSADGSWENIHTEDLPLELKDLGSWIMDQMNSIAHKSGRAIHRRYLSIAPGGTTFRLRVGRSARHYDVRVSAARAAAKGDRTAAGKVLSALQAAVADAKSTET